MRWLRARGVGVLNPWGRLLLAGLACSLSISHAQAKESVEDRLAVLETEIQVLLEKSEKLGRQVAPGKGFFTEDEAIRRYQEMVYLYLIGEYERASEGFFALVTTMALGRSGLHYDSEWYLAECLFHLNNTRSAEQQYQQIKEVSDHPFRDDAIRRLLELYVASGDEEKFYSLYQLQIVSGRVKSTDKITYAVGKAFFAQEDYLHAKTELEAIGKDSSYFMRAAYVRGAIAVAEKDLEYALTVFTDIANTAAESTDERKIWDLAQLALARINMELGNFELATGIYQKIGGQSAYLADKLYELVWALIKQNQALRDQRKAGEDELPKDEVRRMEARERELIQEALRRVEIFLLGFPQHEYTAQLKLLRGQLHLQAVEHERALTSYEQVIVAYTPIREQFKTLADSANAPGEYFERILRMSEGTDDNPDKLPEYAIAMVMADQDLGKAVTVYGDLGHQRKKVQASETIISELEDVFGDSEGIGGFERIRYDVAFQTSLTRQKRLELLALENEWLTDTVSGPEKKVLGTLRIEQDKIGDEIVRANTATDMAGVSEKIESIGAKYKDFRSKVTGGSASVWGARFDGNHTTLKHAGGLLKTANEGLGQLETAEMSRLKSRFDREVEAVSMQREMLAATTLEAERVSTDLTRAGFGRLEDFFAESLLKADVGIIDVYWGQKIEISDEKTRVLNERRHLSEEIGRRFDLIEQKMKI